MFFKKEKLDIYPALKNLYDISKKAQEEIINTGQCISHDQILKEFCTIRVSTSRRGGHDVGLLKFLNKTGLQSFIIFDDNNQRVPFINNLNIETHLRHYIYNDHIFYGRDLSYVDTIIIMNSSFFFSKEDERDIYEFVLRHFRYVKPFYIIFLH